MGIGRGEPWPFLAAAIALALAGCEATPLLQQVHEDLRNAEAASEQQVSGPVFSVAGGTFSADQSISLSSATPGASIYFTIDGSDPSTSKTRASYAGAIKVAGDGSSVEIRAYAVKPGFLASSVVIANYTINYGQVSTPQFSIPGNAYTLG